jgi:Uma2 family endonuclease
MEGGVMSSTVGLVTLEDYWATNYRPDREWIDGEVRERNVGKWEHARVQALLASRLGQNETAWGVQVGTQSRVQVSPRRIRIPDVVLIPAGAQPEVLIDPPVLVVEILSPDDSYSDTQERAQDYLEMGIKAVWLIDPRSRTGRMCIEDAWVLATRLTVPDSSIYCELDGLFAQLPPRQNP